MKVTRRGTVWSVLALVLVLSMVVPWAVLASELNIALLVLDTEETSAEIPQGGSVEITIEAVVTGRQAESASFEIFTVWTLADDVFTGSIPLTFPVPAREAQDAATIIKIPAQIVVAESQAPSTHILEVEPIKITTSGQAKLELKEAAGFTVTVVEAFHELWELTGFYAPVKMSTEDETVINTVKGGSTVPLKFNVFLNDEEVTDPAEVTFAVSSYAGCEGNTADATLELVSTNATGLRYDEVEGQFIQNWKTPKQPGACYIVTLTAGNAELVAYFKLK